MADNAVVTVGTIQSGFNENVIPDEALLRLNIRTFKEAVRSRVLDSVKRIIEAEATASGAPKMPEIREISRFPLTVNDEAAMATTVGAMGEIGRAACRARGCNDVYISVVGVALKKKNKS